MKPINFLSIMHASFDFRTELGPEVRYNVRDAISFDFVMDLINPIALVAGGWEGL